MKAIFSQNMPQASSGANFLGNGVSNLTNSLTRHTNRILDADERLRVAQGISDMGTARDKNATINRMVADHAKASTEHHFKTATFKTNLESQTAEGLARTAHMERTAGLEPTGGLSVLLGGGLIQGQMQADAFRESAIAKGQRAKVEHAEQPAPAEGGFTSHTQGKQGWVQPALGESSGTFGTPGLLNKVMGRGDAVEKTIKGSPSGKRRIDEFSEAGNN